jgi:GTP-binding protein
MIPTVALVGRPNVGKSTLFNRLTGRRKALTHNQPGVTRDRVVGEGRRPSGGLVLFVDTGGFEPESQAPLATLVREQALFAVEQAQVVLLVVDGAEGLASADQELAEALRRAGKPTLVVVNKADRSDARFSAGEAAALGFPTFVVSAEHGTGVAELWEALEQLLPPPEAEELPPPELAVAIVGRPNVGKSSLLNRILGEERVLVSEIPGTTRDAVDTLVCFGEKRALLVDTAGIRRKGRTQRGVEVLSVVLACKAIERAHVCLLVLDGAEGVTAQDAHVAGLVQKAGRGVVVVVNKSDLLSREAKRQLQEDVEFKLKFLKDTPCLFVSALRGSGVSKVLPQAFAVGENFHRRIGTGELNRVLRAAWESHPPPGGKVAPKLFYATQVGTAPPRFALFTNLKGQLHFSYLRYLENALREAFPLAGVPVRFIMRGKQ